MVQYSHNVHSLSATLQHSHLKFWIGGPDHTVPLLRGLGSPWCHGYENRQTGKQKNCLNLLKSHFPNELFRWTKQNQKIYISQQTSNV